MHGLAWHGIAALLFAIYSMDAKILKIIKHKGSKNIYKVLINRVTRLRIGWRDYLMKRTTLGSYQKKWTKIGQPFICQRTKESFNSSMKGKLRVFQNHRKQGKINGFFHHFPSLGINERP